MKHEHRAERDERYGQDCLAEQVVAEQELGRARQVVLEKEPGVEEITDRNVAQQDLAAARQVLEMIVWEFNGEPAEEERTCEHPEIQDAERDTPETRGFGLSVVCAGGHVTLGGGRAGTHPAPARASWTLRGARPDRSPASAQVPCAGQLPVIRPGVTG